MFWAVTTRHSKDNSQKKTRFCAFSFLYQKEGPACGIPQAGPYHCEQNCKPGSVFDSHLSRRIVAGTLKPPREQPGQPLCSHTGVAPDRVYSDGQFPAVGCALTAPFHPYWQTPASASHLPAVYLCCTFPEVAFGGRYPLSLPCGARTFLTTGLSAWPRDCLSYSPVYFSGIRRDCQRLAAMRPPHRRKSPGPSAENTGWPAERS